MSLVKKIALVMAVVLVVGSCAGLIVHKTTEGSQSVVKRPASEGSVGSSDVLSDSPRIFLQVRSDLLSTYSLQILDGEDPSHVYGTLTLTEEGLHSTSEVDYTFFLVSPGVSRIVFPASSPSETKRPDDPVPVCSIQTDIISGEWSEVFYYGSSDFEYVIPLDCYYCAIRR